MPMEMSLALQVVRRLCVTRFRESLRQDLQCGWSWYTEEGSQEAKSGESTLLKFERMEKASNGEELDIATLLLSFFIATNITYDSLNN